MFTLFRRKRKPETIMMSSEELELFRWWLANLYHIERRNAAMALDVSKLNAAVAKLNGDVDTLIAAHQDPAGQAAVDAAEAAVTAVDTKVVAAVAPVAPVAPPAAA